VAPAANERWVLCAVEILLLSRADSLTPTTTTLVVYLFRRLKNKYPTANYQLQAICAGFLPASGLAGLFFTAAFCPFARSAWLVTYAVTRRQLSRFRRQNSVPMDGRGPETVNDVKRNAAVAGAAASTPHIPPVGADLRPSDHDITLPADIDRQPVYAASAAIGRYLPPAPELRQTIRIPHVAAAVDPRGR